MGEGCGRCVHLSLQPRKKKKGETGRIYTSPLPSQVTIATTRHAPRRRQMKTSHLQNVKVAAAEKRRHASVQFVLFWEIRECNRPISVYTWNPSVKSKTVLMRFPTETFPPDSLAAQLSQVDKLSSFLFSTPTQYPPFRPPAGDSRDYILAGTNLQSLLHFMHSMYRYLLIEIK